MKPVSEEQLLELLENHPLFKAALGMVKGKDQERVRNAAISYVKLFAKSLPTQEEIDNLNEEQSKEIKRSIDEANTVVINEQSSSLR